MLAEQKLVDLFVGRARRAFEAVIQKLFTRLSTGSVDNGQALVLRGFERRHQ